MTLENYSAEHVVYVSCDRPGCTIAESGHSHSLEAALDELRERKWRIEPEIDNGWLDACPSWCPKHAGDSLRCDGCGTFFEAKTMTTHRDGDWCARCLEIKGAAYADMLPIQPGSGLTQTSTAELCGSCGSRIAIPLPIPGPVTFERKCPLCGQVYEIRAEMKDETSARLDIRAKIERVDT